MSAKRKKNIYINVKRRVFRSDLLKAVSVFLWISVYIFQMCKFCLLFFKVLLFQMLISNKIQFIHKAYYPVEILKASTYLKKDPFFFSPDAFCRATILCEVCYTCFT